jgi:hypothetical protein
MAICDESSLPLGFSLHSAQLHETQCLKDTIEALHCPLSPQRMLGDKAYDSQGLQLQIYFDYGIELGAPARKNATQTLDTGNKDINRQGRWKIERLFSWLKSFRRLVCRWEYHPENFLAMVHLASILLLLRRF